MDVPDLRRKEKEVKIATASDHAGYDLKKGILS